MGRSSHEQAQKSRQRIVECAARLFREFGVDNVSVAEVMSAADMTIGGFYKHFESKNALVEEVFSLTFEQSSATWRQVSERKYDDPSLRSAAIVDYYLKKKGADQACPMIAFAPHVTSEAADEVFTPILQERDGSPVLAVSRSPGEVRHGERRVVRSGSQGPVRGDDRGRDSSPKRWGTRNGSVR